MLVRGLLRSCGWKCGVRAVTRQGKKRKDEMPSIHVRVPERPHFEYEGNEDALAAMTAAQETNRA